MLPAGLQRYQYFRLEKCQVSPQEMNVQKTRGTRKKPEQVKKGLKHISYVLYITVQGRVKHMQSHPNNILSIIIVLL